MRSTAEMRGNVAKIQAYLADCAAQQVKIAAFPECAVSSYVRDAILALNVSDLRAAETDIAAACRRHAIAAIVGTPQLREGRWFNSALIINARGEILGRYDKVHLAGQDSAWQCVGGSLPPPVFPIEGTRGTVMICHDSRFPEVCRLPVLAGARVVFYISHEAALAKESKMGPYRAQVQARAVENNVFVIHANAPADDVRTGSHGQSRIVAPDGNVIREASQLQEEVLVADLELSEATAKWALDSLTGPAGDWWRGAVRHVPVIE
jgi:predicted amidohydrolase